MKETSPSETLEGLLRVISELTRANEVLAAENARLLALRNNGASDRESQRAALNLMEDAVESRRQAERLNANLTSEMTERRRAEDALRLSEERLRLVLESVREYAIFSTDPERCVQSWNSGAERLLGYTETEILGKPADIIFSPEDRSAGVCELEAATALGEGRATDERWHVRKDGSRFWGSGVMMPMHDAEGKAVGLVKILRDQTTARQAEKALRQSRTQLLEALRETEQARAQVEAASQAKDRFLAILSHELRTPLSPVVMTAMTLQRRRDLDPAIQKGLEMINRNVQLECRLIDDLLDITRIGQGRLEILQAPLDLHDAVHSAVEISRSDIERKNQRLLVQLHAGKSRITGDSVRLRQTIWNILKNASKFTPEEGTICVSTQNVGGTITVEIRDTGCGIDPARLSAIFEAFTQAHDAISREFGGLGLGLAIAKATIEAHGGSIRADSDGVGHGASFVFQLPLAKE